MAALVLYSSVIRTTCPTTGTGSPTARCLSTTRLLAQSATSNAIASGQNQRALGVTRRPRRGTPSASAVSPPPPPRQQDPQQEQREHSSKHARSHEPDEPAVGALGPCRRCQMALQQGHVPKIGFPCEVENIPEERQGAQSRIERHIGGDANQRCARRPQPDRRNEYPASKNGASSVAEAGDQTDDGIETKRKAGAGNPNAGIQPVCEPSCGLKTRRRRRSRVVPRTGDAHARVRRR